MDEAVRPCLRCDTLVEESRAYCPACGSPLSRLKLVLPRPAALSQIHELAGPTRWFGHVLLVCAALAVTALALAAYASL